MGISSSTPWFEIWWSISSEEGCRMICMERKKVDPGMTYIHMMFDEIIVCKVNEQCNVSVTLDLQSKSILFLFTYYPGGHRIVLVDWCD